MNYYDHYIADYQSKTAHLTLAEHGAYLLMLQIYYASERALPADRKLLFRLLRVESKIERAAVESVIRQYWQEGTDGLTNKRASEAVTEYREWVSKQRANGNRGGRPPKTHGLPEIKPNGNPNGSETGDSTSYTTSHTTSHTNVGNPSVTATEGVGTRKRRPETETDSGWRPPTEEEILAGL